MIADLHLHTNCSDGKHSVVDTVKIAKEKGLSVLSITDHDSLEGVKDAIEISHSLGMNCISGLEMSCRNENKDVDFRQDTSIHILAYNIDYENTALKSYIKHYHLERKKILLSLIDELAESGLEEKYDDIFVIAGTQMRIQDIINHLNSSFLRKEKKEKLINIAEGYYNKLFALDAPLSEATKLIKDAGGFSVLAHAFFSYRDYDIITKTHHNVSDLLDYLCELGLDGLEVFYSRFSQKKTEWLLTEAKKRDLLVTAGSDFHGTPQRKDIINSEIAEIRETIHTLLNTNRYV